MALDKTLNERQKQTTSAVNTDWEKVKANLQEVDGCVSWNRYVSFLINPAIYTGGVTLRLQPNVYFKVYFLPFYVHNYRDCEGY